MLVPVDQFCIERHSCWSLLHRCVHETHDHRLQKGNICLFGKQTNRMFDVFMVGEVYLLADEEAFFHTYAEIGYSFHLFAFLAVADCELRYPDAVHIFLIVLNDVIENDVQENK